MPRYKAGVRAHPNPRTGVLLSNLGSPDAPTTGALRRYLREFLADPRVIELPRILWWPILHGFVLTVRPRRSARLYAKIWTPDGSPLVVIGTQQAAALRSELQKRLSTEVEVALGMRYGNPSIPRALDELAARGCDRILVLPLYPQYFGGTTASTFEEVAAALRGWRWIPELRMIAHYHDDPGYIRALATSVRESWERQGQSEKLLLSFHGIPESCRSAGDPYADHCKKTAKLLAEDLGLEEDRWQLAFQSRFGRLVWLEPSTDATLEAWARSGVESVDVVCPGFPADCLETLEEISMQSRKRFQDAGGRAFHYVPALNDRPDHIRVLADLVQRNLEGWQAQEAHSNRSMV